MKNINSLLFLLGTTAFAIEDYDQYDADDSADVVESSGTSAASSANGETSAPLTKRSSAAIGFPTIEYSSVKTESRDGVEVILPTDGKDIPTAVSKWNFGLRLPVQEDIEVMLGMPILDSTDSSGSRTELGNPTIDIATVWVQGKSPQPVKVDFLLHASIPHRGSSAYYAHSRWDTGVGIGTSKRFGRAMFRAQGLYVFKKNSSGATYMVGDMIWAKGGLALSLTKELDIQVMGDFKRAYPLKQESKTLVSTATLNTISPQIIFHMNQTIDLLIGGTFVSNRGSIAGKEAAFGDISYDGILGDQVTVGMGVEI